MTSTYVVAGKKMQGIIKILQYNVYVTLKN